MEKMKNADSGSLKAAGAFFRMQPIFNISSTDSAVTKLAIKMFS